jgi:hypothetical protein
MGAPWEPSMSDLWRWNGYGTRSGSRAPERVLSRFSSDETSPLYENRYLTMGLFHRLNVNIEERCRRA